MPEPPRPPAPQPYIPASTNLPEITVKAVVLGFILSAVLTGANAYLGLKVGMTVSASIPAAVISMAVLRLFRESNILENNIVQTTASAGEAIAAGAIFTLPALVLLHYWQGFPFLPTLAIALAGGTLGVLFTVPLRRALVVESRLKFPEGVAAGEVLKAGAEGGKGAWTLAAAGLAGAFFKLTQTGFKWAASTAGASVTVGRSVFGFGSELGVALLAVGYIVGLNIGIVVLAGGVISWMFAIPMYMALTDPAALAGIVGEARGYDAAFAVWGAQIRYLGVGAMAVGGIWALIELARPVADGIRSSVAALRASRAEGAAHVPRTERDLPFNLVGWGALAMAVPIFFVFTYVVDAEALAITSGLYWATVALGVAFSLVAGFLFSSVAGYMAGLVGSSNNPISGVTIATILAISLILLALLGSQIDFAVDAERAAVAAATAILVGAVVACAAAIAGDNLQDLKAGQVVGATPYKQEVMLVVGVVAGALVIAPVLGLLFTAYGLGDVFPRPGMDPGEVLAAPQAALMASVAQGVFSRNLPWTMIAIGAVIAVAIILVDKALERRDASFRTPVLAVAVGIYLPFELSVPIFIGGLVAHLAPRRVRARAAAYGLPTPVALAGAERNGLLFASGLITGEALMGIALAVPFALTQSTDTLRLMPEGLDWAAAPIALAAYAGFIVWMHRVAGRPDA